MLHGSEKPERKSKAVVFIKEKIRAFNLIMYIFRFPFPMTTVLAGVNHLTLDNLSLLNC